MAIWKTVIWLPCPSCTFLWRFLAELKTISCFIISYIPCKYYINANCFGPVNVI